MYSQRYLADFLADLMFDIPDGTKFELRLLDDCGIKLFFELFDDALFL
jgi:hypothetical protein